MNHFIGSTDIQRFNMNNLVNMNYDIGCILRIAQTNRININTLMANSNNGTTIPKSFFNLDEILPIKNNDELESLEA